MVTRACRLTELGISRFTSFIDSIGGDEEQIFPDEILTGDDYIEIIGEFDGDLASIDLTDKFEAARSLDEFVSALGLDTPERDKGFWTWCSAYLFSELCPKEDGVYKKREIYTMIAFPDKWNRYYRHYLASIWRVWNAHSDNPEDARLLLSGPVNVPGEMWAQVVSRQERFTRKGVVEALTVLFWDAEKNERKRGAGGTAPRRLMDLFSQFDLNWDIGGMNAEDILALLPAEFNRFKS
jgi:hypothetical protein